MGTGLPSQLPLFPDEPRNGREKSWIAELCIDPIQTTFRGGESDFFHQWYPYLEGYSPEFVKAIVATFAPEAQRILDPFSGTGTTPLTVSSIERQGFYCEVNPLLQYLMQTKTAVHLLSHSERERIAEKSFALSDMLQTRFATAAPDHDLHAAFPKIFGKSKYFDTVTYDTVLRARTVVDEISRTDTLLADLLTVAILASLLPSSELIRSGDIRYRTDKEQARKTVFEEEVCRRLTSMANDVAALDKTFKHSPAFLCDDARNIDAISRLGLDLVVTSPPYLNGTNYFRNTKIELWFLRVLESKSDLAAFRYRAVTAGINDVTVEKIGSDIPAAVSDIYKRLAQAAYDKRIPQMALGYFQDMQVIFRKIAGHLKPDATVAVDLGDSVYAGIHIPTDKILAALIQDFGYELEQEVVLRQRLSRDRTKLRQVLLIFRYNGRTKPHNNGRATPITPDTSWHSRWETFKKTLPHQQYPYSKRNWGNQLHSLCSYHGKMKPSLAHHLVDVFLRSGGKLLDPFAGVGTIPFEAALAGAETFGFDINPAAAAISGAKLSRLDEAATEAVLNKLEAYITSETPTDDEFSTVHEMGYNGRIPEYFHPQTLAEILLARRYFLKAPPATGEDNLVLASLLHILHGNRPYALSRRSHPITPYKPTGDTEYRALLPRLRDKVSRSLGIERPETFVPGTIYFQDATAVWPSEVGELDAIITSPPFFDSTRFHVGNWMRLWFCGWNSSDFDVKPQAFIDELQKKSFEIYAPVFQQAREHLKPSGVFVLHLGLSHKSDMARELAQVARHWFTVEDTFVEDVTHLETHGIRDKGTVTGHQFLVLS